MLFFKRKPGESLVIETPAGDIVIELMAGNEIGVHVPPGLAVAPRSAAAPDSSWLPPRPAPHARVA